MTTQDDDGFTARELWGIAWLLGLLGVAAWVLAATFLNDVDAVTRKLGLVVGVAVLASVFSAACTVLSGLKAAEARLRHQD